MMESWMVGGWELDSCAEAELGPHLGPWFQSSPCGCQGAEPCAPRPSSSGQSWAGKSEKQVVTCLSWWLMVACGRAGLAGECVPKASPCR